MIEPSKDLNAKQQMFVEEYLVDLNATKAAIRAGYSAKNADKIASQLLGKTRVGKAIQKGLEEKRKKAKISRQTLIDWLVEVIEYNPTPCFKVDSSGQLFLDRLDPKLLKHVNLKWTKTQYGEQFGVSAANDRLKAIELLWKLMGFSQSTDDTERFRERENRLLCIIRNRSEV